tara:strand:+ start:1639 stop:2559 length:921 start_codon:yes stop_codon:yes gene_type:complete
MKKISNINVSIIIPYYNERKNIIRTIKKIQKQSFKNFEVILVNSSSTDKSFQIVNNYIKKNKLKKILNLNQKTIYPSDSKNLGIKKAKYKYLAFMDCGLNFDKNWLINQIYFLEKYNLEFSLGILSTRAKTSFDAAVISQTWGLNREIVVIPGSIFKRKVFSKMGLFKISRAGYDKLWIQNLSKKYKIVKNKNTLVKYDGNIHSSNYTDLFKKIFNYSYHSGKLFYKKNLFYLLGPFIFIFFLVLYSPIIPLTIYFILRAMFPFIKSKKSFEILKFKILVKLLLVGIVIDTSRFFGYLKRYLDIIF